MRYHRPVDCKPPCPIHAPSDHSMKGWPRILRESGLIERSCTHGVGHPDPDSVAYFEGRGLGGFGVHGCDGCCRDEADLKRLLVDGAAS